ncbi:putative NEP-interacting protein [Thalictrum thalictroides]|uniref:Putative NEP-interacting protein n=1 Tax=Thalictrum thalictroides TaxID=46969 RepID=A0A7J6VYD3_THATH|nr:putative NEP-interacting protein [Thalictrum thalictroides]
MALKFSLILFLVALVGSSLCNFEQVDGRRILSKNEDLELEQQLRVLNKPAIKTIQDEGDLYDCIDINKQPALDHPLLKDHKIQMKPTSRPKSLAIKSSQLRESTKALLRSIGCPEGTVPIQRTTKEDLRRAKSFRETHSLNFRLLATNSPSQHVAGVHSTGAATYYGAQANMNMINPKVTDDQSTLAAITISNKNHAILAGWAVSPSLYGDHNTHLITYWKGDINSGCYNLLCSAGFVLIENHYGFQVKQNTSTLDGIQQEIQILIWHDNKTDNWWVSLPNDSTDHVIDIGYWPGSIVPGLSKGASSVSFGGLTQAPANEPSPPMGYGTFPSNNLKHCGYFAEMKTIDQNEYLTGLVGSWGEFTDSPNCYGAKYFGNEDGNGYVMEYGGPGGSNCAF